MTTLTASTRHNLDRQGFGDLDEESKSRFRWSLRFTPGVGTCLVMIGLVLRSPIWLGSMSLVAVSGALFPRAMAIDLVYNLGFRHLFRAPALPSTPTPRRFSYLLSTILLASSALSFSSGQPVLGWILGGMVVIGGAILTSTLWCLGSWFYRLCFDNGDLR